MLPLPHQFESLPECSQRDELLAALDAVYGLEPQPHGRPRRKHNFGKILPADAPAILGVGGKRKTGKTTVADLIERRYAGSVQVGFSAGIIAEANAYFAMNAVKHHLTDENKIHPLYRQLLQAWAQAGRKIDSGYLSRRMVETAETLLNEGHSLVIASGLREPDEIEAIHSADGHVWRVVRPGLKPETAADFHVNETALDEVPDEVFDAVIINDGSLLNLARATVAAFEQPADVDIARFYAAAF